MSPAVEKREQRLGTKSMILEPYEADGSGERTVKNSQGLGTYPQIDFSPLITNTEV